MIDTIRDLIDKLQSYDPNAKIRIERRVRIMDDDYFIPTPIDGLYEMSSDIILIEEGE